MFGFDTLMWVLFIASTAYSIHTKVQQANAIRSARQEYYNKLQQYNQKQIAFTSAKASDKDARQNAQKYSLISDSLVEDANRREGISKQNIEARRPLAQMQRDFGNKYASLQDHLRAKNEIDSLIADPKFNKEPEFTKKPDFMAYNFNVEKFNTNYLGEVQDGNV